MPGAVRVIDNFADLAGQCQAAQMAAGAPHYCYLVAANDAPAKVKATADYVCDYDADDVQIQAALDAAYAAGQGKVFLSSGSFKLSAPLTWYSGMMLEGAGINTTTIAVAKDVDCGIFEFANLGSGRLFGMMRNFSASGGSTPYAIDAVVTGAGGSFSLAAANGDRTGEFQAGRTLRIFGSTNNDGSWTIASSSYTGGKTVIVVDGGETVNATADGTATWKTSNNYFIKNTSAGAKWHYDFHIHNVYALRFGGHIIESYQAWGWDISHCILENSWGNALEFDVNTGGSGCTGGLKCSFSKIKDVRGFSVRIDGGNQWTIIGNEFAGNEDKSATGKYAIQIEEAASQFLILGNRFTLTATQNNLEGIIRLTQVTNAPYDFCIQGNTITMGGSPAAGFDLIDYGTANYGVIVGNDLKGKVSDSNTQDPNILPLTGSSRRVVMHGNYFAPHRLRASMLGGNVRIHDDGHTLVQTGGTDRTFTLPPVTDVNCGMRVAFCNLGTGKMTIAANGTGRIYGSGAGGTIYSDDDGGVTTQTSPYLELELVSATGGVGIWQPVSMIGTWVTT